MESEMVTISKVEYDRLVKENRTLKNSELYERLLEFENNIQDKKYSRKDLGF